MAGQGAVTQYTRDLARALQEQDGRKSASLLSVIFRTRKERQRQHIHLGEALALTNVLTPLIAHTHRKQARMPSIWQISHRVEEMKLEKTMGQMVEHHLRCLVAIAKGEEACVLAFEEHRHSMTHFLNGWFGTGEGSMPPWATEILHTLVLDLRMLAERVLPLIIPSIRP